MASAQQVIDFLVREFNCEKVDVNVYKVGFEMQSGRAQTVWIAFEGGYLHLTSPFAWQSNISGTAAIEKNHSMFGIVGINGAYALKQVLLLEDVDESEVRNGLQDLAIAAEEIERNLGLSDEF